MGQESGKKGAGAVDLQPTIPKPDRLLRLLLPCWRHDLGFDFSQQSD
jgi:hypothetical protein